MSPTVVEFRRQYWLVCIPLWASLLYLLHRHYDQLGIVPSWQFPIMFFACVWMAAQLVFAHLNQEFKDDPSDLNVVVVVPVYNEDPITFRQTLNSMSSQSRKPDAICVIDDGSESVDCLKAFEAWNDGTIPAKYIYRENNGKREAQAVAFRNHPTADIFVTVDSDTVLDPHAIENGLKPFANPKVQSVAGLLLGLNHRANLLTRLIELGFVTSFLSGRAAWSRLRSVGVNCGGLAFYRAAVIRKHLDTYLSQTVVGKKVTFGDDRMLTNYALLEGWTVFQQSSVGYTLYPVKLTHLTRQRIRWWRSFWWGGDWLMRRFSPSRIIWWMVTFQFVSFAFFSLATPYILFVSPVARHSLPLAFFVYIFALGYVRNARYLSIKRPGESFFRQFGTYLLSPGSVLLNSYVCSTLQYVGLFTLRKTGWNTRQQVEVGLSEAA